jgi:two-component system, OmpR family, KDP operon response regulator KdpE
MPPRASSPWMVDPNTVQPLVLVVARAYEAQRALASALAASGLRSVQAGPGLGDVARALSFAPDLVLLDAGASGLDGAGVTASIRDGTGVPILVVLERGEAPARAGILDAGASDYIVRPFGPGDLVARVRVWLRQAARSGTTTSAQEMSRERLRFDCERRALFVDGREVHVTPLECRLVRVLSQTSARPLSGEQILQSVWGADARPPIQYLRALVRQLRQKIERDPSRPQHLVNTPAAGYRLKLG